MADTDKLELLFDQEKDTPGTRKFKERKPTDGSRAPVGNFYLTKEALVAIGSPSSVKVTIEPIS